MFYNFSTVKSLLAGFTLSVALISGIQAATTRTVGVDKDFTDIRSAIFGSVAGDTIEVYDGVYDTGVDEIFLDRSLTIVEATGNTAKIIAQAIVVTGESCVLDGIDIEIGGTSDLMTSAGRTVFWISGIGSITVRNLAITDTAAASGVGLNHVMITTGFTSATLDGVTVNLDDASMAGASLFAINGPETITLNDCEINSKGEHSLYVYAQAEEAGPTYTGKIVANRTTLSKPAGAVGKLASVYSGSIELNNCDLIMTGAVDRGVYMSLFTAAPSNKQPTVTLNGCRFNATDDVNGVTYSRMIGIDEPTSVVNLTNNSFVYNPNTTSPGVIFAEYGGTITMKHNTVVATVANTNNRVMNSAFFDGSTSWTLTATVQNNLFSIPGSDVGAIAKLNGDNNITAGTNLVYLDQGSGLNDLLGGTRITSDPLLALDNIHLTATSPAIDAGTNSVGVTVDIDGNARPVAAGYDLGADEFTVTVTRSAHWSLY